MPQNIPPKTKQQAPSTAFTLREILFKYLANLPLFILSIVICVGAGYIYVRYKVPIYVASAPLLVKSGDDNLISSNNANTNDPISTALSGGKKVNMDNEMEQVRSFPLIERVVRNNQFNIYYYKEGNVKRFELFKEAGFELVPVQIRDSNNVYKLKIVETNLNGVVMEIGNDQKKQQQLVRWNDTVEYYGMRFVLKNNSVPSSVSKDVLNVIWKPVYQTVGEIQGSLGVSLPNPKTTSLLLNIKVENRKKGEAILDALIKEYKIYNIEDKNRVAQNTIRFIEGRMKIVADELNDINNQIKEFKIRNHITELSALSQIYFAETQQYRKEIEGYDVRMSIVTIVEDYLNHPSNINKIVPSNMGIEDPVFGSLVVVYNQLQMKKEKDYPSVSKDGLLTSDIDNQIAETKKSLFISLKNYRKYLTNQQNEVKKKLLDSDIKLSGIPEKEKELMDINRQKTIKETLYAYLLNKKEETNITSSSTVSNYVQLAPAYSSSIPVEPKTSNIRLFTLLLGLIIPVLIIYVLELMNDKLTTKEDITKKTSIPIIGEISHVDKAMGSIIVNQSRNITAEQFRIMRSNLQFLFTKGGHNKTILVTSSISGEGKSFISLNLAAVLSLSDKKVALLEFDLRKMRSTRYSGENQNSKGITNYLIGQVTDHHDIITSIEKYPTLHIYRSGPIPPNPGELIMSDKVEAFIEALKKEYDYIIIDSAPVGLVSDSYALVNYTDIVIYVLRQRYTFKKQIELVDEIVQSEKLRNVAIVVNDVQLGGKYGYYGYGYGYGYGYIYRYGFGYRYGYGTYISKYFKKGNEGYFDDPKKGGII
jgi:capsular exopolysaccharide synthesis family protein